MAEKKVKISEILSTFLRFIESAKSDYRFFYEEVNRQDKLTQDYLHSLELDELNRNQRSKIATALRNNRRDRRHCKDMAEELSPLITFLEDPQSQKLIRGLERVLGETRKQEEVHQRRFYVPKVKKRNVSEVDAVSDEKVV